jgi:hypothetical protein
MGTSRIRWSDQAHRGSSFSDTEQVIRKLQEEGKFAGLRYRNGYSRALMGKSFLVHSLWLSREFLNQHAKWLRIH